MKFDEPTTSNTQGAQSTTQRGGGNFFQRLLKNRKIAPTSTATDAGANAEIAQEPTSDAPNTEHHFEFDHATQAPTQLQPEPASIPVTEPATSPAPEAPQKPEQLTEPVSAETNYQEPLESNPAQLEITRHSTKLPASKELDTKLKEVRLNEEELLTKKIANNWHIKYINLENYPIESDALTMTPLKRAQSARATAFKINNKDLFLAIENPNNVEAQALINEYTREGYTVTPYMVSPHSMRKLIDRYGDTRLTSKSHGGIMDVNTDRLALISERVKTNSDVQDLIQELLARPREQGITSELIEIIMGSAIATKSSDVHIESQEENARLRLRQDGVLQDVYDLPLDINKSLANRIKILSGLKLTITKDAQDGRFSVEFGDTQIEVRVSTIPGPYGEGIVMRILDPRGLTVDFDKLGIEPKMLELFMESIKKPEGIILTTGPTGSGKTTTLYSFLKNIYNPEIKVITIEDPIEYHLSGIQQTQVDHAKGYDFLSGLRAAMRQDPEVIMVGEIRDAETAITAIQASQTGHLVLSTLHTNNAAGVIPRLLALDVNPSLLAATLKLSIAQRLVRRLVPDTKQSRPATERENSIIRRIIARANKFNKDLERFGIDTSATTFTVYDPVSSEESTGYKGRIGLYEVIVTDKAIESLLHSNPSERQIRDTAETQGYLTMQEDAVVKILTGITSFDEIMSVIDLELDLDPESEAIPATESSIQKSRQHHTTVTPSDPLPSFTMDTQQLETMWNYLKTLRAEQALSPDDARAEQIRDTETIIMDIMKRNHGMSGVTAESTGSVIESEVSMLEDELAELRELAKKNPDPEIAKKLKQMHAIIDSV